MGIAPNQYPIIWQAICWWMERKLLTPDVLARLTGYSIHSIKRGIRSGTEYLTSDFVHACVDAFGLRNSRQRGIEDTAYDLTDDECVYLLTSALTVRARQGKLWD